MLNPNQYRRTPDDLFEALTKRFGPFDLDAAADETNHRCKKWYGEQADALAHLWILGDLGPEAIKAGMTPSLRVFCNPPWCEPVPWLKKAYTEAQRHPDALVVVVLHQTWSAGVAPWLEKADEILQLVNPRPMFRIPKGWYKCEGCKKFFLDKTVYPNDGAVCMDCGPKGKALKDSSNSKDVQIIVYRYKPHNTPPKIQLWRWK